MEILFRSLTQHSAGVLLVLCAATAAIALWLWKLQRAQARALGHIREILQTVDGRDFAEMLREHADERRKCLEGVRALQAHIDRLERELSEGKRHLGIVRFDAFPEVGGNQSFALALYDDDGNGVVLSGIAGRTDTRLYCKPLLNGRSDRKLSQEEQRAIRDAMSDGPRTMVTP